MVGFIHKALSWPLQFRLCLGVCVASGDWNGWLGCDGKTRCEQALL